MKIFYMVIDRNGGGVGKGMCAAEVWPATSVSFNPNLRFVQLDPADYDLISADPTKFYLDQTLNQLFPKTKVVLVASDTQLTAGVPITWLAVADNTIHPHWTAETIYSTDTLISPTNPNLFAFQASIDPSYQSSTGTSGSLEPVWPNVVGGVVVDRDQVFVSWGNTPSSLQIEIGGISMVHTAFATVVSVVPGQFKCVVTDAKYWSDPIFINAEAVIPSGM